MANRSIFQFESYKINDYIALKFERGRTYIYINGRKFLQCIQLALQITKDEVAIFDSIDSIDQAEEVYNKSIWQNKILEHDHIIRSGKNYDISPEEEFWGHCSNIQVWVEHEYDTRLLHRNLAFPLLRKLVEAGDNSAKRVFKEEIAMRLSSGYPSVVRYLLNEGYLTYLSIDEIEAIPNFNPTLSFYFDLADYYFSRRKFNKVDKISRLILRKETQSLSALNKLVSLFGRIHKYNKAIETMLKVLEIDPLNRTRWKELAELFIKEHNYESAMEATIKALSLDFNDGVTFRTFNFLMTKLKKSRLHISRDIYLYILLNSGEEQDYIEETTKCYRRYKSRYKNLYGKRRGLMKR